MVGAEVGGEMSQSYQQQQRVILTDLYYKGYHEGKGDIPNMDDVEITKVQAAINALNAEMIGEDEELSFPINKDTYTASQRAAGRNQNRADLRQRFGVES